MTDQSAPMLWVTFATAALSNSNLVVDGDEDDLNAVAEIADRMLDDYFLLMWIWEPLTQCWLRRTDEDQEQDEE